MSDGDLLAAYVGRQQDAFGEIMHRHGGLVLGVCRSALGNTPDAEDATQAVFLALINRASSLQTHPTLAGWLHRVAWHVAIQAKQTIKIRARHEREAVNMRQNHAQEKEENVSLDMVHAGLSRLPDKYRLPIILHHLEGRSQEEVAGLLGSNVGAVAMRLNRGRQMLRDRLVKTGTAVSVAALTIAMASQASASVSAALAAATTKAAMSIMLGQAAYAAAISSKIMALTKGALNMLFWAKMKTAAVLAAAVLLVGGTATSTYLAVAAGPGSGAAKPPAVTTKTAEVVAPPVTIAPAPAQPGEIIKGISVTQNPPADVFTITDEVQIKDPPRFGTNFQPGFCRPWTNMRLLNIWNDQATFEPVVFRHIHTLQKSTPGTNFIETEAFAPGKGYATLSYYGSLLMSGIYDGAELRIYRNEGGSYKQIHKTIVKSSVQEPGTNEKIELAAPCPSPTQDGDILVFTKTYNGDFPKFKDRTTGKIEASYGPPAGFLPSRNSSVEAVMDASTCAPEGGSTTSLKIKLPGGGKGFEQPYLSTQEKYLALDKGAKYKFQIWMKQEGLTGGKVDVVIGKQCTAAYDVTAEWKKYEAEFSADMAKENINASMLSVTTQNAGTLWIDNLLIWKADEEPFAVTKRHAEELKSFHPGSIRVWPGLDTGSLDVWLSDGFAELRSQLVRGGVPCIPSATSGLSIRRALELCASIGNSPETRADPWLIIYVMWSDEEIAHFMEYLGAPPDVGYGKLRAKHGHPEPWLNEFKKIYIEIGNETWNQGFKPLAWDDPAIYAAVANRSHKLIKQSPYYNKAKISCVACGWKVMGWTPKLAALATETDFIDLTSYYGGFDGVTVLGADDKAFYTRQLLYNGWIDAPFAEGAITAIQSAAAAQKREIGMCIYEGGPGYQNPQPGKPFDAQSEQVGKSLAMGTLTLDSYMDYLQRGCPSLNYYTYQTGYNWATHSDEANFIPYPPWLALKMRNTLCSGDLVKVKADSVKTLAVADSEVDRMTWDGRKIKSKVPGRSNIPNTICYAFHDGKKHSVILINRSYDEPRQVTLNLPFDPREKAAIHKLTHPDPRANNIDKPNVTIQVEDVSKLVKTYTLTLPPASVYVLVCEEK
ncbi:MAG: sigma-70 family RNA polymerase sigma factor [Planctomycetes bacterium]|nr:sigma-70 family RNA polymerase sigma factor [Planctomycetota bacterium]